MNPIPPQKTKTGVEQVFEQACRELPPLAPGARLLLGCSAGGDSMTLLELAAGQAAARNWALAVAHLDHCQRPQSGEEARFVLDRAAHWQIPAFVERLGKPLRDAGPLSEDAMRQARQACFRRWMGLWHADALLLAHQADDRAETFLIRLLAGSGPTGLGSIRPIEPLAGLTIVRPLLGARRAEMRLYLEARGVSWREDPSNADLATKRGWIRRELLPAMAEKIGLDPTERIARGAELIQEEAATLREAMRLILNEICWPADPPALGRLDLLHPLWRNAGLLLQRQLLRQWLWELRCDPHPPGYAAVQEALTFVKHSRPGAQLRTIERMHLVHCKNSLLAFPPEVDASLRKAFSAPLI